MIIYENSKKGFLKDSFTDDIEMVVLDAFRSRHGRGVAESEIRSWKESLLCMAKVLSDEQIPDNAGIAIEYSIPQTSKRVDFLIAGQSAELRDQIVIIELKQWATAERTDRDGIVRTRFQRGMADVSHPSYQAWSYASLLADFNETAQQDNVELLPCAYLHNCSDSADLQDAFYEHYLKQAPLFFKGRDERHRLARYIREHVRYGDDRNLLYRIEHGRIRPSRRLIDTLTGLLAGNREFVLIDDQKVAYENILHLADVPPGSQKQVVIVHGGPGTGKSVVAINLLVELTRRQKLAKYVTKNSAPRAVFESVLAGTHRRTQIANLFCGSGSFTEIEQNTFDALVVDEAHRLNEKSGLYGNLGNNQIDELISSSRCAVFFLDEDQRVTFKDIGEADTIQRFAGRHGAQLTELRLESQFRCNGSNAYLAWLDHMLGIRETANQTLEKGEFDFRVYESPEAMRQDIVQLNQVSNKARMVAGYCWDWKSKRHSGEKDVVIPEFGFGMTWNLTKDGGLWMIAPESVSQIGCIHTCQGLEVDYIGVIVGPDLVYESGEVRTRPEMRSRRDKSLSGYKKLLQQNPGEAKRRADLIIRNTYRTLMTRGMKGCFVYFVDSVLAEMFKSCSTRVCQ